MPDIGFNVDLGGIADIFSGFHAQGRANRHFWYQYAQQDDAMRKGMQIRTADLQAAGLNPMLAYMSGAPHASPVPDNTKNFMEGAGTRLASARVMREQVENMRTERENIKADTELKEAALPESLSRTEVNKKMLDEIQSRIQLNMSSAALQSVKYNEVLKTIDKISADIQNVNADTTLKGDQAAAARATVIANYAKAALDDMATQEKQALLPALVELMTNDAYRSKLLLPHAENMSNAEYSVWKQVISPYLSDMGDVVKFGGGALAVSRMQQILNKSPIGRGFNPGN